MDPPAFKKLENLILSLLAWGGHCPESQCYYFGDRFALHEPLHYRGLIFNPFCTPCLRVFTLVLQLCQVMATPLTGYVALYSLELEALRVSDITGLTTRSSWSVNVGYKVCVCLQHWYWNIRTDLQPALCHVKGRNHCAGCTLETWKRCVRL